MTTVMRLCCTSTRNDYHDPDCIVGANEKLQRIKEHAPEMLAELKTMCAICRGIGDSLGVPSLVDDPRTMDIRLLWYDRADQIKTLIDKAEGNS